MLSNKIFLITGIADNHSLAMYTAKEIIKQGGKVICTGLGVSEHHKGLSEKAKIFLTKNFEDFKNAVSEEIEEAQVEILDVTIDENIESFARNLSQRNIKLDGMLHAIAMDKTIRNKEVKPLIDVTKDEFCDTMDVSAYSLIRLIHYLLKHNVLERGSSICSLSYIAAEKVTFHPYRNISIAKAALERISVELADELGRSHDIRVNVIRFSPFMGSKAGNATLNIEDVNTSDKMSPLGNAKPMDLAHEVVHLFRPNLRITGEIRHVDGGYHITG
ncbi:MAG: SDR family oxidoreductase [Lentimicrobiaceae bacterium]|jgi:enoyl-[acyl-carrier protein] reductase I|nr:SDR family oxidoreductase [Lentimicrobiaceae bacterium]MCP4910366.1 SDR family oxidoreductase [Bacteroidota bacterium]MBT3453624.1 SDR family oxidoreductase [Lentimicrobiaceae bacterium]MBT3817766.1 SDR family oxidoreductase [Lentimicrobiaceae bacterium]MBT4061092.1 SDR family oxidoreductase [Lentimicrobiaceae bacterium]